MTTIIAANGGRAGGWARDKLFVDVDGEPILARTARQFAPVIITAPDPSYAFGAELFTPPDDDYGDLGPLLTNRPLWEGRTVILLGDVAFSDAAVQRIRRRRKGITVYGRAGGSKRSGTDWGEIFAIAFDPDDFATVAEHAERVLASGHWRRGLWEWYRSLQGVGLDEHVTDRRFVTIDDDTDDFDSPSVYNAWLGGRTVILVPRREGIPERDVIWAWCRKRWETLHPDLPVYEGHHDDGPFNRSAALNTAARLADADGRWDQAVVIDADVFIDPANVREAIAVARRTGRVTWAFGWWAGMRQDATADVLAGKMDPDALVAEVAALHAAGTPNALGHTPVPAVIPAALEKINPVSWSCCFVVPRSAWDRLGGFDERFAGWGWEDMAFQSAAVGLVGHERIGGAVLHLWHPRHPGLGDDGVNKRRNRQLGRRYMHALRALGLHDRAMPSDDAEMERDRLNLLSLMAKEERGRFGPAPDLPDWSDWLPTLDELVASWKSGLPAGPAPRIAFVVRTGGKAENWPARSVYLREMLESFDCHVSHDRVAARVVFSDWPPEVTPELTAIAEAHGFYVTGEGNAGFTPSMLRLWRYLDTRTWSYDQAFLVEDDFRFERDVDLDAMSRVLADHPHLVQMALLRDACYPRERELGGVLGHPDEAFERKERWMEHRRFFTLNPTLIRRSLFNEPWPNAQHSEAVFGRRLFRDPSKRAGLWGQGEAWITHLGEVRAGGGY